MTAELEVETRTKLHDAWIVGSCETSEGGAVHVEYVAVLTVVNGVTAAWQEEVSAIQDVEHFKPELQVLGFAEANVTEETRVPVEVNRTVDEVNRQRSG